MRALLEQTIRGQSPHSDGVLSGRPLEHENVSSPGVLADRDSLARCPSIRNSSMTLAESNIEKHQVPHADGNHFEDQLQKVSGSFKNQS